MIQVGKPRKKRAFDFDGQAKTCGNCLLVDKTLYLLRSASEGAQLVDINLEEFDNNESGVTVFPLPEVFGGSGIYRRLTKFGSCILIEGPKALIFDANENKIIFDNAHIAASSGEGGFAAFHENYFYQVVDKFRSEKGIDVYDVKLGKLVEHLDIDIRVPTTHPLGFLIGERNEQLLTVFSLREGRVVYTLSAQDYCQHDYLRFSAVNSTIGEHRLTVVCGGVLVVIDLVSLEITHEIDYLHSDEMTTFVSEFSTTLGYCYAHTVKGWNNFVVLAGGSHRGYVILIDLSSDVPIRWLYPSYHNTTALYSGGDLVFGTERSRAVAWDAYAGDQIWEASAASISDHPVVGDGWIAYHNSTSYVECYRWKSPYVSPHRPPDSLNNQD